MYDIEREKAILKILEQRGTIGVNRLASLVYCSGSTIRRDLTKLEKKGLVKRAFGSVSLSNEIATEEISFSSRELVNISTKKKLSKAAASCISNSQIVFIDSSTTLFHIVPYLNELKNLLIVTNGLKIAAEITSRTSHKVVMIGGEVQPHTNSTLGSSSIKQAAAFHTDICLLSTTGVSLDFGFSEASYDSALLKKQMIENSSKNIMVFDESKFGQKKAFRTCDIKKADAIIVPFGFDNTIIEDIQKLGVEVIVAPDSIS